MNGGGQVVGVGRESFGFEIEVHNRIIQRGIAEIKSEAIPIDGNRKQQAVRLGIVLGILRRVTGLRAQSK